MRLAVGMLTGITILVTHQTGSAPLTPPRFTRVTDQPPATERASTGGVTWIDYDGDGDQDLFVANGYNVSAETAVPQTNRLYENLGEGRFAARSNRLSEDAGFSSGSAWADFDNDGDADLFVPNQRNTNNFLYRNEGQGRFTPLADAAPMNDGGVSYSASWGDLDGDGFVDLFVSNGGLSGTGINRLYRNRGGNRFEPVTTGPVVSDSLQSGGPSFIDFDLDGDLDLYVAGRSTRLFRNDGGFRFTAVEAPFVSERPLLSVSLSGAWGDFDNDGDLDLYQTYMHGEVNRLYVNDAGTFRRGSAGFATLDGSYTVHAMWVDLDNNGYLDLVVTNWGSPANIYLQQDGSFDKVTLGSMGTEMGFGSGAAAADYDDDGDLDVFMGHWPDYPGPGEANLLYRNDGPGGNWLRVHLTGRRSNRSAIGARVMATVILDGREQTLTREVRSMDGWRGQSELPVHFGIGSAQEVRELAIHWPSGHVQRLTNLRAGQRLSIVEP